MRGVDPRLLRASRPARVHLVVTVSLGVAGAALVVLQAVLLARAIARGSLGGATLAELTPTLVALGVVLLLRSSTEVGAEISGRIGAARVLSDLRGRLARHLLVRRSGVTGREPAGELATLAVQGVDALEPWLAGYLPRLVLAAVVPPVTIAWLFTVDAWAALVLALTVPVLVVFLVLVGLAAKERTEARWESMQRLGGHFLEVVQGLATLRAHARDGAQARTLASVSDRYRRDTMGTLRVAFLSALVLELAAMIGTALVAATVGVQLAEGRLGLEAGLTVLLLAPEMYGPLRQVGQQFHASADGTQAVGRLLDALEEPATLVDAPDVPLEAPDPRRDAVRLEGVAFAYPDRDRTVLREIDLELPPGSITALVGPSGCGKSTLAALVLRLADPTSGRVTCGGIDLRDVELDAWRARLAWVPQFPRVFAGTIAENVRLGAPTASAQRVEQALREANLGALLTGLPQGVDTRVGEGGRPLSAGEAQRLALARVVVSDAPLLVVDEPTAHLDERSAAEVADALRRLAAGRTVLIAEHRPQLAALADRVVALDHGRIVRADPSVLPTSEEVLVA
ncbi:thiol reductant ABC exporter subunit CydD [Paraconexibacter sp.]|uniref:thiol reductant ABC exporter subunit CydD n=1 Tax=Paraconexibacter sp. TaxID=2949640 RepID=UPI0035641555